MALACLPYRPDCVWTQHDDHGVHVPALESVEADRLMKAREQAPTQECGIEPDRLEMNHHAGKEQERRYDDRGNKNRTLPLGAKDFRTRKEAESSRHDQGGNSDPIVE